MAISFSDLNTALHSEFNNATLTYTPRGGVAVSGKSAAKGSCKVEILSSDGNVLSQDGSCTFIIKQADLKTAGGAAITPRHGDVISDGTKTYDVHAGEPDSQGLNWLVHCIEKA